jgi:hypothetical protein
MLRLATFALGFTAGWVARGTTGTSRSAALTILAAALAAIDRIKRAAAIEKDRLEDLVAEARARADVLVDEDRAARARGTNGHDAGKRSAVDEAAA